MREFDATLDTPERFDAFAVARWLGDRSNSSAAAVSDDRVEWQCSTWGSGRGGGAWTDTAVFCVVAEVFGLSTGRNHDGRDELIVSVPVSRFVHIAQLISRLERMEPEMWPWLSRDAADPISVAAEFLGLSQADLADNVALLDALRIE